MTHKTNKYGIYEVDSSKFGGIIYPSDYNTDYKGKSNTHGSSIAARIVADRNFDDKCRKNIEILKLKGGRK